MKRFKRYGLGAILTAILLFTLLKSLGSVDLKSILLGIELDLLLISFAFYLVAAVLRVMRISLTYAGYKIPFVKLFGVSSLHTFLSNIFPSRLGEVSFIYLMRRVFGQGFKRNAVILIFLRLLDLFVVVTFFITSALVVGFASFKGGNFLLIFLLALVFGFFSFYLIRLIGLLTRLIKFLLKSFPRETRAYASRLVTFFEALGQIALIKNFGMYLKILFLSIGIWIFLFLSGYFLTLSLGLGLSGKLFVFGATSSTLTSLIPISSFGAFGTYELGWLGAYALADLESDKAILAGLSLHVASLFFSLILALVGLVIIYFPISKKYDMS